MRNLTLEKTFVFVLQVKFVPLSQIRKNDMKKLIVGLLLFLPLQILMGQDKIITIQQDTILCRIISISPTHIQYEQNVNGYMVGKFIRTEQVLEYYRTPQTSEPKPYDLANVQKFNPPKPERLWMMGVYPGRGTLLASTADDEKEMIAMGIPKSQAVDYNKKLKHGWSLGGDIHYMFSDHFGLGVKYSLFTSSVKQEFTISISSYIPTFICIGMSERIYIHFAGPSVVFRQWLDENRKFQLTGTLSAGYVYYRDETRMDPNQYTFTLLPPSSGQSMSIYNFLADSKTWGANACFSADYFPVTWLSVGVNAGLMYARLTKLDLSTKETTDTVDLDKKDYQSLARFDYSISIRFHF